MASVSNDHVVSVVKIGVHEMPRRRSRPIHDVVTPRRQAMVLSDQPLADNHFTTAEVSSAVKGFGFHMMLSYGHIIAYILYMSSDFCESKISFLRHDFCLTFFKNLLHCVYRNSPTAGQGGKQRKSL